jgi:hypothetical protein
MVGRMGGQSVVIRAEKGKVKMLVDDAAGQEKELVYDARKDIDHEDKPTNPQGIRSAAEDNGRVVDLERAAHELQVCQELSISPTLLGQWQNLAIEGMLKALDPKKKDPLPPLNHRLSRLIEKKLAGPNGRWRSGSRHSRSSRPGNRGTDAKRPSARRPRD